MKKVRILMTTFVFVIAVVGATASKLSSSAAAVTTYYGSTSSNGCMASSTILESGCGNGGQFQCSVVIDNASASNYGEIAPAYSLQPNAFTCAKPLRYN